MPEVAVSSCIYGGQQLRKLLHKFAPNHPQTSEKVSFKFPETPYFPKVMKPELKKVDHACVHCIDASLANSFAHKFNTRAALNVGETLVSVNGTRNDSHCDHFCAYMYVSIIINAQTVFITTTTTALVISTNPCSEQHYNIVVELKLFFQLKI